MAMDESALGAVPMLPSVRPFPRPLAEAALRVSTQRALHCDCLQPELARVPGVGDLGAAIPVSGDRDLGEVEQLDPIGRGSHPAAGAAGVVSADGHAELKASRTSRRCTPYLRDSARIDNPSMRKSRRIATINSTFDFGAAITALVSTTCGN